MLQSPVSPPLRLWAHAHTSDLGYQACIVVYFFGRYSFVYLSKLLKTHFKSLILQVGEQYAKDNRLMFLETSAKTAQNVNELFYEIGEYIHCLSFCSSGIFSTISAAYRPKSFSKEIFCINLRTEEVYYLFFFDHWRGLLPGTVFSLLQLAGLHLFKPYKHLLLLIIIYRLQERDWQKLPLPSRAGWNYREEDHKKGKEDSVVPADPGICEEKQ